MDLPTNLYVHCQVTLGLSRIFVASGNHFEDNENSSDAFILDLETEEVIVLPPLNKGSSALAACGLIRSEENGDEVVVVDEGSTKIFNLESNEWLDGNPIPSRFDEGAAVVQRLNSFLVMGGSPLDDVTQALDQVWEMDPETHEWIERPPMSSPRAQFVAVAISDENLPLNCLID